MAPDLSAADARRISLGAQGFARPRPARAGAAQVLAAVRRLGLLQLDPINVLIPAHYMPPYSRVGPYDRAALDGLVGWPPRTPRTPRRGLRALTEQWAHAASIIPVEHWELMRHRNENDRRSWALARWHARNRAFAADVLAEVRARGPLAAEDITEPPGARKPRKENWEWTMGKAALEALVALGEVAVAGRRGDRARLYDLAERIVGAHHAHALDADTAHRELVRLSARALGVATAADLADYYRLSPRDARRSIAELVDAGDLRAVRVEGWDAPAYLDPAARTPRRIDAAALLSPFDPLVWFRDRALRLFGFDYRIEIYTPPAKRRYGYYVLPFLLGDTLVARVDLKADRAAGRLLVQAAHAEPGVARAPVAAALARELAVMAGWLGLGGITVGRRGDLSKYIRKHARW